MHVYKRETWRWEQVTIHPSSVNSGLEHIEPDLGNPRPCPLIMFEEITRGDSRLYVRQCTATKPHFLPLVASHINIVPDEDFPIQGLYGDADGDPKYVQ